MLKTVQILDEYTTIYLKNQEYSCTTIVSNIKIHVIMLLSNFTPSIIWKSAKLIKLDF